MDLSRALAAFPSVRIATPEDNSRILEFYDQSALSGTSIRLRSVRSPDFFSLLRFQSDRFTVALDEDSTGAIRGIATLTHRPGYIAGVEREVAYLGDFRVSFNREAMKVWRAFYVALLETNDVPTITCVIDENLSAQNALIRKRRGGFQYETLSAYRMINVLGRAPWALGRTRFSPGYFARRASKGDLPSIEAFLDRQARSRAFGYCYGTGELQRRLSTWSGFKVEDFFVLEKGGSLVACFALWSPAPSKMNVIEKIPRHFALYRPFVHVPRPGMALKTMYLTHLEVERSLSAEERRARFAELFGFMADHAWEAGWHMVAFCDFPKLRLADGLRRRFLTQEVPMKLFTVRLAAAVDLELSPHEREEPGFEIALV